MRKLLGVVLFLMCSTMLVFAADPTALLFVASPFVARISSNDSFPVWTKLTAEALYDCQGIYLLDLR